MIYPCICLSIYLSPHTLHWFMVIRHLEDLAHCLFPLLFRVFPTNFACRKCHRYHSLHLFATQKSLALTVIPSWKTFHAPNTSQYVLPIALWVNTIIGHLGDCLFDWPHSCPKTWYSQNSSSFWRLFPDLAHAISSKENIARYWHISAFLKVPLPCMAPSPTSCAQPGVPHANSCSRLSIYNVFKLACQP